MRPFLAGLLLPLGLSLFLGCSPPEPLARETSPPPRRVPAKETAEPPSSPSPTLVATPPVPLASPFSGQSPLVTPSPASPQILTPGQEQPTSSLALALPGPAKAQGEGDPSLASLLARARESRMAADWRKAGERALKLELYGQAASAFRQEAGIYRSKGILQAALAQEARANQFSTDLSLYLSGPAAPPRKLARLEPASGCYVGAFIDRDRNLSQFMKASQTHGDVDEFNQMTGKPHASFFMYRSYGQPFPTEWARYLKQRDAIVHIAWEPKALSQVRQDAYLKDFVDELVALDHPVMLRFASEMNGEWTPYHGNPAAYIKAFQLIHTATRRAPKVAVMWCPNTIPRQGLEAYYPGDEFVDWVGVNFYSVPFLDNERSRPGDRIHPTDHLRAVYDLYSARKPIAVGEWAASRQSRVEPKPLTEFAKTKISQLYGSLPTRYPRVKMVNWYDSNNLQEAVPTRQLNNYQVTSPPDLLSHYSKAVSSPYYLGAGDAPAALSYRPIFGKASVSRQSALRVALKTYDQRPKVYFRVNGALVLATDDPLDWRLEGSLWKPGKNTVDVFVFDQKDRFVTRQSATLELPEG